MVAYSIHNPKEHGSNPGHDERIITSIVRCRKVLSCKPGFYIRIQGGKIKIPESFGGVANGHSLLQEEYFS